MEVDWTLRGAVTAATSQPRGTNQTFAGKWRETRTLTRHVNPTTITSNVMHMYIGVMNLLQPITRKRGIITTRMWTNQRLALLEFAILLQPTLQPESVF